MAVKTATASTETAAGLKTPGRGTFSDPAQVGAMIQQMYPEYANFDPAVIGQRWIDKHTPASGSGGGGGIDLGNADLQPPAETGGTTPTGISLNSPDLSGLARFQKPMQQPTPKVIISGLTGNSPYGSQLTPMSTPVQYKAPPAQAPQNQLALSTLNLSKAGL